MTWFIFSVQIIYFQYRSTNREANFELHDNKSMGLKLDPPKFSSLLGKNQLKENSLKIYFSVFQGFEKILVEFGQKF